MVPNPEAQSSPPPLALSGNLGLVVLKDVGAGDLPMVALSEHDVEDENDSPVYRSPRTQMSSELPTKRSMYGLLSPEMEAMHKQIAEQGLGSLSQIPENLRVLQQLSQSSVGRSLALVQVSPRPESPRDPFEIPSPEWGRSISPLKALVEVPLLQAQR